MSPSKTIAFFGATGDSAGYCLAAALKNSHTCTALARNPAKLTSSLEAKGVSIDQQSRFLAITQGDIRDTEAVAKSLRDSNGKVVDIIVSGIGPTSFYLYPSLLAPVGIVDSTLCREASRTVLSALPTDTPQQPKPLLINISTTGIPSPGAPRDVPLLWLPLYRWLLHHPHVDKGEMESNLRSVMEKSEGERGIRGFINVKPTLLSDGDGYGWEKIRYGHEKEPALGYFIARKDVGEWIYERIVKGEGFDESWVGAAVTLTN